MLRSEAEAYIAKWALRASRWLRAEISSARESMTARRADLITRWPVPLIYALTGILS